MPNAITIKVTNTPIRGLIMGPPKTGKTEFLGTWPSPYFFDFDNTVEANFVGRNVFYHKYVDLNSKKPIAFLSAEKRLNQIRDSFAVNGKIIFDVEADEFVSSKLDKLEAHHQVIESVHIDGATEMQRVIMNMVNAGQGRADEVTLDKEQYVPQKMHLVRFVCKLLSLPVHVWIACHDTIKEITIKSKKGSGADVNLGVKGYPLLVGDLRNSMGGMVHMVFRTSIGVDAKGNKKFALQTTPQRGDLYDLGHRFGDAFDVFEEPTSQNIINKLVIWQKKQIERERVKKIEEQKET